MLNKVILMGRLCADPEIKQTTSGVNVCRFRIAVNRPYKKDAEEQKADFINVSCWRTTADFVGRFFSKGKMIIVEGSLRNNDYTDGNGVKHYSMEVLANNVSFGESKNASGNDAPSSESVPKFGSVPAAPARHPAPQTAATAQTDNPLGNLDEFEEILSDGDVPF